MSHRPLAVLDCETTGTNPENDRLIDLAVAFIENGAISQAPLCYRFNPGIPIPAEATAVHGIKDEDVQAFPPFQEAAGEIARLLTGVDIAGYCPRLLDLPLLAAEFERANVEWGFCAEIIDVRGIYMKHHPRDLTAAVKTYLGREHDGAHGALADSLATAQVFLAQLACQPELADMLPEQLARFSQASDVELVDLSGKLARGKDGEMYFTFGKHKGKIVRNCRDYALWMLGKDFPAHTKRKLLEEIDRIDGRVFREAEPGKEASIPFAWLLPFFLAAGTSLL